jgi:hypothetical protein
MLQFDPSSTTVLQVVNHSLTITIESIHSLFSMQGKKAYLKNLDPALSPVQPLEADTFREPWKYGTNFRVRKHEGRKQQFR